MLRSDREDISGQQAAVEAARSELGECLMVLTKVAAQARLAARSRRGVPDLPTVYAAVNGVRRAEEALDLALLDLATAQGEDA